MCIYIQNSSDNNQTQCTLDHIAGRQQRFSVSSQKQRIAMDLTEEFCGFWVEIHNFARIAFAWNPNECMDKCIYTTDIQISVRCDQYSAMKMEVEIWSFCISCNCVYLDMCCQLLPISYLCLFDVDLSCFKFISKLEQLVNVEETLQNTLRGVHFSILTLENKTKMHLWSK